MRLFSSLHHIPLSQDLQSKNFIVPFHSKMCTSLTLLYLSNDVTSSRLAQISFSDDFLHIFLRKREVSSTLGTHTQFWHVPSMTSCPSFQRQQGQLPVCTLTGSCVPSQLEISRIPKEPVTMRFCYPVLHRAYQAC